MKRIIVLSILFFYASPLFCSELSMLTFRKHQRQLALGEFKALYKQRNYQTHKRNLRLKYKRIKKIHNRSIMDNTALIIQAAEAEKSKIESSSLQIKASNKLDLIIKDKIDNNRINSIAEIIQDVDTNMPNIPVNGDTPVPNIPNNGDNPVPNIPNNGDNPVPNIPNNGDNPVPNIPVNDNPSEPNTPDNGDITTPTEPIDSVNDGNINTTAEVINPGIRSLNANPWKRK